MHYLHARHNATAAAVAAISDSVALAVETIALATPAQATHLLANGAIEVVLGSISRVATILLEEAAFDARGGAGSNAAATPISAQKLTQSVEEFAVSLISKALEGSPASSSAEATVLQSEDGRTTVAYKVATELPTVTLSHATIAGDSPPLFQQRWNVALMMAPTPLPSHRLRS